MHKLRILRLAAQIGWCGLVAGVTPAMRGDEIPGLAVVPDTLPSEPRAGFAQQRQNLDRELRSFLAAADAFNAKKAEDQTDADYDALQAQRTQYIAAARAFNGSLAAAIQAQPTAEDRALMRHQWEMSIDWRYRNDPTFQAYIHDLWKLATEGDSDANDKLVAVLADQLKADGWTKTQRDDFFAAINTFIRGEGPTPKNWANASDEARKMDRWVDPAYIVLPDHLPLYHSELVGSPGEVAASVTANAAYMAPGRQHPYDCTLYAIANGAQVPLQRVQEEFGSTMKNLGMEPIEDRNNPGLALTSPNQGGRGGIGTYEEFMIGSKLGKVIAVPTDSFATAIEMTGKPVITSVFIDDKQDSHAVAVTGVYRRKDGGVYYSVMDSTLEGYPNFTAYVEKSKFESHLETAGFVVTRSTGN